MKQKKTPELVYQTVEKYLIDRHGTTVEEAQRLSHGEAMEFILKKMRFIPISVLLKSAPEMADILYTTDQMEKEKAQVTAADIECSVQASIDEIAASDTDSE